MSNLVFSQPLSNDLSAEAADRAVGTCRLYQLNPKGIEDVRAELDVFWAKALDAYKSIADERGHHG